MPDHEYALHFRESSFWDKLASAARAAGREAVEKALSLYYAVQDPATPVWAKTVIYSALGYFILPMDMIPDLIPAAGYADDLGFLAGAVAVCALQVTPEVRAKARRQWDAWFGNAPVLDA